MVDRATLPLHATSQSPFEHLGRVEEKWDAEEGAQEAQKAKKKVLLPSRTLALKAGKNFTKNHKDSNGEGRWGGERER
jgi:hypothetical protein